MILPLGCMVFFRFFSSHLPKGQKGIPFIYEAALCAVLDVDHVVPNHRSFRVADSERDFTKHQICSADRDQIQRAPS